jgi:anaerobic ribonucleoside-triphosphate reductase
MTHSFSSEDDSLQAAIQQSLQEIAEQMGEPITSEIATQLYREAVDLLSHVDYAPITLARVAGALLVYQVKQVEAEEVEWFKSQIQEATEAEAIEELIESMSRTDAL